MRPRTQSIENLQRELKIPQGQDGFYLEKHPKFGPVETNIQGVFICGCDQGPKDIADSIAQANAVAAKVDALLARSTIEMDPISSYVNTTLCRGCGACVEVCEYEALQLESQDGKMVATVNEALCKGCGTCATFCSTGAIEYLDETVELEKRRKKMAERFLEINKD